MKVKNDHRSKFSNLSNFQALSFQLLNWKIYCDDHSLLSYNIMTALLTTKFVLVAPYTLYYNLTSVVQTSDSTIHWIKVYPVDNAIGFPNTYPQDSDLSGG